MRRFGGPFRVLPTAHVLGIVQRLSAWPLFFVGARALSPAHYLLVTILLAIGIVALGLPKTRRASIASGVLVAIAAFGAARATLAGLGLPGPTVLGAAIAAGAGATFARANALLHAGTLDAGVVAFAPVVQWVALSAVLTRFGAEAVHLHGTIQPFSIGLAALAALLAIPASRAVAATRALLRTIDERTAPFRVIRAEPGDTSPLLTASAHTDSVLVASPTAGPYRTGTAEAIARVPHDLRSIVERYGRHVRAALATAALATAGLLVVASSAPASAHHVTLDERPFPRPLPGSCADHEPRLVFMPTEGLVAVDIQAVAERYRKVVGLEVEVTPPLRLDGAAWNRDRKQYIAEEIIAAAQAARRMDTGSLVIVVTDRDIYLRDRGWRYAFAGNSTITSVVSVARMAGDFPWDHPMTYGAARPPCPQVLDERAYKMITRQLLMWRCSAEPSLPNSVRRSSVMSIADLDAIDERIY